MGHVRLGTLPASRKWRDVVSYLAGAEVDVADLAEAVARASDRSLTNAAKDPAFIEALWLLVQIPWAARSERFAEALGKLGIAVPDHPSATELVVGLDGAIEAVQRRNARDITDLGEMAKQAAVAALHSLFEERLPELWAPTCEDVRTTLATFVAPERFGELSHRFFAHLVEHNIQYFLDRETPRHIGSGRFAQSVGDLVLHDRAVRRHCEEATIIMRPFAKDWLGHNAFHLRKDISRRDAAGFAHVAFEKIRKELSIRSSASEDL